MKNSDSDPNTDYLPVDNGAQRSLFSRFNAAENESRTFATYDLIPRFLFSKSRSEIKKEIHTFPEVRIGDKKFAVSLTPAMIQTGKGSKTIFPGIREELIERTLRYMAVQQLIGVELEKDRDITQGHRISVVFSLYSLKKELAKRGHSLNLSQIKEGLEVLRKCDLEVVGDITPKYVGILSGSLLSVPVKSFAKGDDPNGKKSL